MDNPISKDRFRIRLGDRVFLLPDASVVLVVLLSSLVLSRAIVVLFTTFDLGVETLSSLICQEGDCNSFVGMAPIDSHTASTHWNGTMFAMSPDGPRGLIQALCRWDCGWYAYIWSTGYNTEPFPNSAASWAFFPLFPLAVAIIANWWPSSAIGYAILLNHVFLLATGWLLYLLARHLLGNRNLGLTAAVLFIVSPMSLYSGIPLSESLFNMLSIGALYAAVRGRWLTAGLAMALLTATRPYGLFIVLPVLMIGMREVGFRAFFRIGGNERIWLALALAPMGIFLYALYLYLTAGDALAFSHVQEHWGRRMEDWTINIYKYFEINWGHGRYWRPLYMASVGVLGMCLAGYLAVRKRFPEAVFLGLICILATGTSLNSLPRICLGIWPAYLALAMILQGRPRITIAVAAVFVALLPIHTVAWINGHVWTA